MQFEDQLGQVFERYYDEYTRPLKYLDPRNMSKKGNPNLFNEHNQTVSFYQALRQCFPNAVGWFELSIGKKANAETGRESTNAIDGIVYIPECHTLLIIEAKGLRRHSKFVAIADDLKRTLGTERSSAEEIANYKLKLKEKPRQVYAVTLADIWSRTDRSEHGWSWGIDFDKDVLESRNKCEAAYQQYNEISVLKDNPSVRWWGSKTFRLDDDTPNCRLLAMVCPMSKEQIDTYNWV